MSGYIPYEYLQELGPYGIKYVCDMPKTKKTQSRQVKAICPECRNPETNHLLRFDFYFPDYNLCLEYNGKQHYESCGTRGWNTPEALIKRKRLDEIKIQFCKTHNINIIVIPYWDCNKITSEYLFNLINNTNDDDSEDDIFE